MLLERHETPEEVAAAAADRVADLLRRRPGAVVLLPAGATPVPLFAELVQRARAGRLDLAGARLFQLDERVGVGPDDPRSFAAFLRRHLLEPLGLDGELLDGSAPDPRAEIERHARSLEAAGGADLALLGIGTNGHVAFNEPGTPADAPGRVVELAEATRRGQAAEFDGAGPAEGLTLGLRELTAARRVVILATGGGKAPVLARLLAGEAGETLPAAHLRGHREIVVLADRAAAGEAGKPSAHP